MSDEGALQVRPLESNGMGLNEGPCAAGCEPPQPRCADPPLGVPAKVADNDNDFRFIRSMQHDPPHHRPRAMLCGDSRVAAD